MLGTAVGGQGGGAGGGRTEKAGWMGDGGGEGQTVSELEGSEVKEAGGGGGCCHIHPYHSGRQFSKCFSPSLFFFLRGTKVCILSQ